MAVDLQCDVILRAGMLGESACMYIYLLPYRDLDCGSLRYINPESPQHHWPSIDGANAATAHPEPNVHTLQSISNMRLLIYT